MQRDQLEMLKQIQALQFTAVDFHLYLDTHPTDQRALADYANTVREMEQLKAVYTRNYGPLLPTDNLCEPCWRWIEEPWPWEIEY
jgi:spore coat protein JB